MEAFYQEPDHTIYCGHALDILREIPAESVDMVMTSPPYWGLRTYKTEPIIWGENHCEHEWGQEVKGKEYGRHDTNDPTSTNFGAWKSWDGDTGNKAGNFCLKCHAWKGEVGLEPTIELYIEHLILIFNEVKRVLKRTGTCWVNLDDSYNANYRGSGPDNATAKQLSNAGTTEFMGRDKRPELVQGGCATWSTREQYRPVRADLPAKSLCLIPQRFAIAMVENGWIPRNDIVWNKPNPMPESVKDRFTGSWEHLFFFAKQGHYYFEQQFEAYTEPLNRWGGDFTKATDLSKDSDSLFAVQEREGRNRRPNELGRNKRDVWEINTEPYPEAHFATFPEKLCETPILAGCPSMICKRCGKAREKVYDHELVDTEGWGKAIKDTTGELQGSQSMIRNGKGRAGTGINRELGYTDCGCNAGFEPGVLLDPFAGSGTAQAVAKRLGRKSIGIDLSPNYCKLTIRRLQEIPMAMPLFVCNSTL